MGLAKSLWKSVALRTGIGFGQILDLTNAEIARDNPSMMFVTGVCGAIDLGTGRIAHASAGHDAPFLLLPGAAPARLADCAGPPMGLDAGIRYGSAETVLPEGGVLILFSDGVTEAENRVRHLYGIDGLAACLAALPQGLTAAGIADRILADIEAFVGDRQPADDLTLMVLRRPPAAAREGEGLDAAPPVG